MILKTAYYNSGTTSHSALVQEEKYLTHSVVHEFDNPARVAIILNDPDGSIMQKYGIATNEVYVGPGRAYIEENSVCKFDGRIVKVQGIMKNKKYRVIMFAEDWFSQLGEERISYDMREPIDGVDLRQSNLKSDIDGAKFPVTKNYLSAVKTFDTSTTTYVDFLTEASDVVEDDVELLPSPLGDEDHFYMGFSARASSVTINITTPGIWAGSVIWYYSKGGGFWDTLDNLLPADAASQQFEVGGKITYSWDIPVDWNQNVVDGQSLWWIRVRVLSFSSETTQPLGAYITEGSRAYDDDMSWDPDEWNGYYFVVPHAMAGKRTISTGPYDESIDITLDTTDSPAAGEENVWEDDDVYHEMEDANNDWLVTYNFRQPILDKDLFVAGSLTGMRLKFVHSLDSAAPVGVITDISLHETPGADFLYLQRKTFDNDGDTKSITYTVPLDVITDLLVGGEIDCLIQTGTAAAPTNLTVVQLLLEIDVETTGYPELLEIKDTLSNYLVFDEDVDDAGLWEDCEYSICKEIYKHINGLVTSGDDLMTLTTSVESTSGISTRHYDERTRMWMIQDLVKMDKAVVFVPLGTKQVVYKSTFNDGAPAAMTDDSVLQWGSEYDYKLMKNEYHVSGVRSSETVQVHVETEDIAVDPGSDSKLKYGMSRTGVVSSSGTMTYRDAVELGTALVERDEDLHLFLDATIAGYSTYELGDEVSITSTYLGLTAEKYVVTYFAYDHATWRTQLRLHPRVSNGFVNRVVYGEYIRDLDRQTQDNTIDSFIAGLISQEWTND